jgi:hypothetical protein
MKKYALTLIFLSLCIIAFGQKKPKTATKTNSMDLSKINHPNVKKAIEALQAHDRTTWFSLFTKDAIFTDDGREMNFKSFFDNAFDKKEKFLSIDKIENNGKDIYGNFYAGQWRTFKVFFKFKENEAGKFSRIDIGQTAR